MGLGLAVKRSYRYFLPQSLFEPRKVVRESIDPLHLLVLGFLMGTTIQWRWHSDERTIWILAAVVLGLRALRWWSGAPRADGC